MAAVRYGLIVAAMVMTVAAVKDTDYYDVLKVEPTASDREIRKAFKKLALKMHPDKNTGDPNANDKFVEINKIYETLKDPDTRKKYDRLGKRGFEDDEKNPVPPEFHDWNFYQQDFGMYLSRFICMFDPMCCNNQDRL